MIKHIVAFRFKNDVPRSLREEIISELNQFPQRFPAMRRWTMGANISRRDDRFSHAFVVEFDSEQELTDYLDTAEHEEFLVNRFRPYIEERMIVTYEV
jgi:2,3-dihydroxy-p-cumate/2,3-dihydroxybenzoate 3,4-dioxygenase